MRRRATAAAEKVASTAASAAQACGINLWRSEEETWWYVAGLLLLQVFSQEVFKRVGPFKSDGALMAHQICSMVCIFFCSIWSFYYWLGEASTVEDRLYGPTVGAVVIGRVNLAFQVYDLAVSLCVKRLRKVEMILHHTFAVALCYFLLRDCYVHWYAIFYLGVSEISSVPLAFVDVFKYFPDLAAKYPTLNSTLRMAFALLFILVRAMYWPVISGRHLLDTVHSIRAGTVHNSGVVALFTIGNLLLTLLQWYWAYLIVRAAIKMMSKKKEGGVADGGSVSAQGAGGDKEKTT